MCSRRWLGAILVAGLVIRLGWGLTRPTDDAAIDLLPDQRGYLELGRNLLRGDGLHYVDHRFNQTVYATRTPGYPAFIALCGGSIRTVRILQSLIDVSTALAAFVLARRLLNSECAGAWAAGFVAFNPFLVYFSGLLLTETLYTAMLAWGMVLLVGRGWIAGIAVLAIAIHVRPSGVGLPVLLTIASAILIRKRSPAGPRQRTWTRVVVAIILTFAVLLPWAYRNHRIFDRWVWTTSNDGISAYDGFNPEATGESAQQHFLERMPHVGQMGEMQRNDFFAAEAKQYIREHPSRVVALTLRKIARTWSPVPLSEEFGRPSYRVIAGVFAVPFYLLVLIGVVRGTVPKRVKFFLLLPAVYFTVIHAMSVGSLRYRVPVEPVLAVLAALGAVHGSQASRLNDCGKEEG